MKRKLLCTVHSDGSYQQQVNAALIDSISEWMNGRKRENGGKRRLEGWTELPNGNAESKRHQTPLFKFPVSTSLRAWQRHWAKCQNTWLTACLFVCLFVGGHLLKKEMIRFDDWLFPASFIEHEWDSEMNQATLSLFRDRLVWATRMTREAKIAPPSSSVSKRSPIPFK